MTIHKESVLLVDDEEAIRCILNKGLAMRGYLCDEAEDAEQALVKLEKHPADLVILDINMPGRLGNEVLPEITQRFSDTAVIMASANTDNRTIAQCIKDGAQDYIKKPFKFEEILRSVGTALDKRKLELEIQQYFLGEKQMTKAQPNGPRKLFLGAVQTLINTLEAGDSYTKGHSQVVADIARVMGEQMGLSHEALEDLHWAALLHDVGKIAVDPNILNKPSQLTSSEYRHIMTHAVVGPKLVQPFVNERVVEIISHHHDHYDGSGLEQTTSGEEIPLGARIVSVADAYQAMTSDRPYRRALSKQHALSELVLCSGTQFDPTVANVLINIIQSQKEHPRRVKPLRQRVS